MSIMISVVVCLILVYFYFLSVQNQKKIKQSQIRHEEFLKTENDKEKIIYSVLTQLDKLKPELQHVSTKVVVDHKELVELISSNEIDIKKKGGDEQILKFMMVSKFMNVFRDEVINFQRTYGNVEEIEGIKKDISEKLKFHKNHYGRIDGRYGLNWRYDGQEYSLVINNPQSISDYENSFGQKRFIKEFTKNHKTILENFDSLVNNFEYLKSLSVSMLLFYLSDRMVKYYEVYQIFEQLGTFDRTWEKKIFRKMEDIDDKLEIISESLQSIEYTTSKLIDNTDEIVSELKNINSQLDTSNLLLTINTYQTWRINRNTK